MTDYRQIIRQRMGDPDATYLYRGASLDGLVQMVETGRVEGEQCGLITGSFDGDPPIVQRGTPVGELDWKTGPELSADSLPVTGGFTDLFGQTRRFQGKQFGTVAVFEADKIDLQPIQYDRDWMDAHPGVLCHVLTTADYEIRLEDKGLWGIVETRPQADGTRVARVEHFGSMPATSEESRFANESEWVTLSPSVSTDRGLRAVVSRISERSIEDRVAEAFGYSATSVEDAASALYGHIRERIGGRAEVAVLVTKRGASRSGEVWAPGDLRFVFAAGERRRPTEIEGYLRGEKP
jgi:hypothetical protein